MATTVQIYNLVGTLVGTEARVTDPDDNRTLPRTVRAVWDVQRRAAIRDGEWNFACLRAGLPALALSAAETAQLRPFGYAYELPAGALKLVELIDDPGRDRYRLEGRRILAYASAPLYIRYCVDVTEPALWDDQFADAFAKRIAWTIGKRIAGSAYDATAGERIYWKAIGDAKGTDARENPPLEQEESDWVLARWGGYPADPTRWG